MKEENKERFTIIDEFNNEREAEVITVLEADDKKYIVYSLDVDADNCDVLVSRLIENEDGTSIIEDINDEEERNKIHNIVDELLNA